MAHPASAPGVPQHRCVGSMSAVTAAGTGSKHRVLTQESHHPSPGIHGVRTRFSLLSRIKKADETKLAAARSSYSARATKWPGHLSSREEHT